jgi:hypothetical protein
VACFMHRFAHNSVFCADCCGPPNMMAKHAFGGGGVGGPGD